MVGVDGECTDPPAVTLESTVQLQSLILVLFRQKKSVFVGLNQGLVTNDFIKLNKHILFEVTVNFFLY